MRLLLDESVPSRLRKALPTQNLPYQQNLNTLPVAVVVLDAHSIDLAALLPLVPALEAQLGSLVPKSCVRVVSSA